MHVALLTGGDSSEREVALRSAENVKEALLEFSSVEPFVFPEDIDLFLLKRSEFDCVVPVFHGSGGEDGVVQGFLEQLAVPYLFSDVEASAVAFNKLLTKELLSSKGVNTPSWSVVSREGGRYTKSAVLKVVDGGSSIGVALVRSPEEYSSFFTSLPDSPALVFEEQLIVGREFTVGVIECGDDLRALPVIEIKSKNDFFDFESKYDAGLVDEICPADIEDRLKQELQQLAITAHKSVGARHVSRSDMMMDQDDLVWFLEINTIPGLTNESLLPKALKEEGVELSDLLKRWIQQIV